MNMVNYGKSGGEKGGERGRGGRGGGGIGEHFAARDAAKG